MDVKSANGSKIALPAPNDPVAGTVGQVIGRPFPRPISLPQLWAPAWFYSALTWLGRRYVDANNVEQRFNIFMAGSDVDPYQHIGSTRLFLVIRVGEGFRLSIAPDADSPASASEGTTYPAPMRAFARCTPNSPAARCSRT